MTKVIEEIKSNDLRQILILSDRKQQLEEMFKIAKENEIESVGYYVGGMKKEKLKENESCKILLGTFPMANEGLDIPSLNGLVLATPKSDIIQSIGRICRMKHENIQPIIIDIVDKFSIFDNQSNKRFNVYKKKKYKITDINYNLDKNIQLMTKDYMFHISSKDEKSDEDLSNDDLTNDDSTNDDLTNDNNNINKLFNSFSLFK
jgi:superfamily II DNA or RNA helicase